MDRFSRHSGGFDRRVARAAGEYRRIRQANARGTTYMGLRTDLRPWFNLRYLFKQWLTHVTR